MRELLLRADDLEHLAHRLAPDLELVAAFGALRVLGLERGGDEGDELGAALAAADRRARVRPSRVSSIARSTGGAWRDALR